MVSPVPVVVLFVVAPAVVFVVASAVAAPVGARTRKLKLEQDANIEAVRLKNGDFF